MLPKASDSAGALREQSVPRAKVLLVDDQLRDLHYYAAILQEQGYAVQSCVSYNEGVRCLETQSFDFIVVSQGSHAFEGRLLVRRALEIDRRTPILVLTRSVDMDCYLEAMQLGAVDYLEKPLAPAEMARVVETHLRPRSAAA